MDINHDDEERKRCVEAQFVDTKTPELIQRVTSVMPIVDELLTMRMIHDEKYAEIKAEITAQGKMRKLFESLNSGGDKVKREFYYLLQKHEKHLLEDLGGVNRKRKLDVDEEYPGPSKKLHTESNQQDSTSTQQDPNTAGPTYIVNNVVNVPQSSHIHPFVSVPAAPKTVKKPPAPKKEKIPAPKKEKKPPAPQKEKKPPALKKEKITAPQKEKKPPPPKKEKIPAPKKEKKPPAPKKEKKPPAPKKEKKPPAPMKEKKPPASKKEKIPAPKKEKKPPAPMKGKKPPAPKKEKKPPAPKKEKKPPAPQKGKKPPAPKKGKKPPAPKKGKKPAGQK